MEREHGAVEWWQEEDRNFGSGLVRRGGICAQQVGAERNPRTQRGSEEERK